MKPQDRIIQACQELIMEYGYKNFSMNQLALRAGVSKRTLYRYFASKDKVIEECLDCFMQSMAESVENMLEKESDPARLINMIFSALIAKSNFALNPRSINDLHRHYPHLWIKIDKFRQDRIHYIFSTLSARNNRQLFNNTDPRIALAVISASVQAVLNPDFILDNGITFQDAARQLSQLFLCAFVKSS